MKRWIAAALVLVSIAGGAYWWRRGAAAVSTPTDSEFSTAKVEKGPIRLSVASTGRVISNLDVEIKCKASGQIVSLPVDVSSSVQKGDLLAELDPADEQRLLQQAEISLEASKAKLSQARQNLLIAQKSIETGRKRAASALKSAQARAKDASAKADRMKSLLDKKLTSEESYETARTSAIQTAAELDSATIQVDEVEIEELGIALKRDDVTYAEAQVHTNEINLALAQQRVKDTVISAPMDGVVSARPAQIGQIISSGISNVGGGSSVMTLSDLSHLFVLASVDESDIGKVEVGQRARITADAFPGVSFRGEIVRIATRGVNTQNVVTFEVKIEVRGENRLLLKPEMTANVEILAASKDDALLIPSDAIARRRGEQFVLIPAKDGGTEERVVQVGITDGLNTEIVSGLAEGDTVVFRKGATASQWRAGGNGDAARQAQRAQRMMMGGGAGRPGR